MNAAAKEEGFLCPRYHAFVRGAQWADKNPAWISVKDKLPPEDTRVLIYTSDGSVNFGAYLSSIHTFCLHWANGDEGKILFWMPIPKPNICNDDWG
jgi:hypothetical protein